MCICNTHLHCIESDTQEVHAGEEFCSSVKMMMFCEKDQALDIDVSDYFWTDSPTHSLAYRYIIIEYLFH